MTLNERDRADPMHPVSIEINLRPLRIGFLVDPAERSILSDVVRLAGCFWGGTMCPLIPVMETVPKPWRPKPEPWSGEPVPPSKPADITRAYLRYFEPDVFVETRAGQLRAARLSPNRSIANQRCWDFSALISTQGWRGQYFAIGVGMDAVYDHLFREEYQFKRREEARVLEFTKADAVSTAFFETAYGVFPESGTLDGFAESYRTALSAEATTPDIDAWKLIEGSHARFPLSYTNYGINATFHDGRPLCSSSIPTPLPT